MSKNRGKQFTREEWLKVRAASKPTPRIFHRSQTVHDMGEGRVSVVGHTYRKQQHKG